MIVRRLGASRLPSGSSLGGVDQLRREMFRLLDALDGTMAELPSAGVFPALNVTQDAGSFYVRAELPGVKAEDIEVSAVNQTLTLSGNRAPPAEGEAVSYHRQERPSGAFSRSITLPSEFDAGRVSAQLTDGLLSITLPKPEKAKPLQIAVKAS